MKYLLKFGVLGIYLQVFGCLGYSNLPRYANAGCIFIYSSRFTLFGRTTVFLGGSDVLKILPGNPMFMFICGISNIYIYKVP